MTAARALLTTATDQDGSRLRAKARLARAEGALDELAAADTERTHVRSALESRDPVAAGQRAKLVGAWLEQVEVALELGASAEARTWLDQLLPLVDRADVELDPRELVLRVEFDLLAGELALAEHRPRVAERHFDAAHSRLRQLLGDGASPYEQRLALGLARAQRATGQLALARASYERALTVGTSTATLRELAALALTSDEADESASYLRRASEILVSGPPVDRVTVQRELAAAYMAGSHWAAARHALDVGLSIARERGPDALERECERDLDIWRSACEPPEASMKTSLVILHLSDLHFGPHGRFAGLRAKQVAERFGLAIERKREEAGLGAIDLVVISGDLTEAARPKEFEQAREFCEVLNGQRGFSLGRERWVFVPGNHDLSWPRIKMARAEQDEEGFDDEELERRIHASKWTHYRAFVAGFYAGFMDQLHRVELGAAGWAHELPQLRVSMGLLDSCETTTDVERRGQVTPGQAQALLNHWRVAKPRLRILVGHHNPQEVGEQARKAALEWLTKAVEAGKADERSIEHFVADTFGMLGRDDVKRLATQAQVSLYLHGHVHESRHDNWEWVDGERRTHVLGAGSAGASVEHLPPLQPVGLQLLSIDLEQGTGAVHRLRYEPRALEPGRIELGTFVEEARELGGVQPLQISLPDGFESEDAVADELPGTSENRFLREYRARLSARDDFWRWEGPRRRGNRQIPLVGLDQMYVPLRIDAGYDQDDFEAGEPIDADALIARERGLLVRGGPGSGKSTWLRWVFRRLLRCQDVLPVFLELRALAQRWSMLSEQPRSLEHYLEIWLEETIGAGWREAFFEALGCGSPRPVLLIDGWDELGDLGTHLGPQLMRFVAEYPRALVVVTSRPHGEGISELSRCFDELQLQPMSDAEIATFARGFHDTLDRGSEAAEHFLATLEIYPQAKAMGRTPLLLLMLLIIGGDRKIPDQRHELYRVCIEDLLDARPKQRQALGVLQSSQEWAPPHYKQRLLATARLATEFQTKRVTSPGWGLALATREQLTSLLDDWDPHEREGFLNWLVNSAGLLSERDDGYLQFVHLGFQEYLTAVHLNEVHDGHDARLAQFRVMASRTKWSEVLRLWAALVEGRQLDRLGSALLLHSDGYWLLGSILADGLVESCWSPWLAQLPSSFGPDDGLVSQACARAWSKSQQHGRRSELGARLCSVVSGWTWLERERAQCWGQWASVAKVLPLPEEVSITRWVLEARERGPNSSELHMAWGRVWMSASPFWGIDRLEVLALRMWPSPRSWIGWVLQSAVGVGMTTSELLSTPWHRLFADDEPSTYSESVDANTRELTRTIGESNDSLDVAHDLIKDWASFLKLNELCASMTPGWPLHVADWIRACEQSPSTSFPWVRANVEQEAQLLVSSYAGGQEMAPLTLPPDLYLLIAFSGEFAGSRTVFAHSRATDPLSTLLRYAAQYSLGHIQGPYTPPPFDGDPLWPALARHIARCSTEDDRAELIHRVKDPDAYPQASDALRWALRYWIGGDIMLENGSTMTLDALWAKLRENFPGDAEQLQALPWLVDMPPDVELESEPQA